jgi:hypothetical protein
VVENDLRALTTAQHWFDVSLTSFALVTFGAGVGCGLVLDDRLIEGSDRAVGLIDHLDTPVDSLEAGMAVTIHPALPPIPLTVRPMEFAEWAHGAAVVAIQRHLQLPTASTA